MAPVGTMTAPNCPVCGKFMDKVEAQVTKQLSVGGKVEVGQVVTAWVCSSCKK